MRSASSAASTLASGEGMCQGNVRPIAAARCALLRSGVDARGLLPGRRNPALYLTGLPALETLGERSGMIDRRALLRALGLGLLGVPFGAAAQPAGRTYRIGFLGGASAPGYAS